MALGDMTCRITQNGDVRAAITLLPINGQIGERYREVLERHHPHLLTR